MKKFEVSVLNSNFSVLVTLLSYSSPFEFLGDIENELSKYINNGVVLLDEYAHNDDVEKRFISFFYSRGRICENTIGFVDVDDDESLLEKSNGVLIKNKDLLLDIGVEVELF
ncbi:type II toxin-antitoxin system RnlB family antitoxin [Proteiniclasticum ruminis]|uniref:Antitoxin to toxin RNase LS or RnlA n=1 Tax=Proteiniclasticum ruminis TaxID=398199 RepID=A0A1I4ZN50_9CLOT|nr:type II toxin-antitoxin system RnlB family antitoxin [Proteiniclasticum ruminis]SFN51701.1 Antitoxin to toxin RNase LS or RnlA [Proteiniclasticum ruminis]